MHEFIVDKESISLDLFLKQHLGLGNRGLKRLIHSGKIKVNNKVCKKRTWRLSLGDKVLVLKPEYRIKADNFDLNILNTNKDIYGVYKPPNVHSSKGIGSPNMEEILTHHYLRSVYLLNRLDFLTSGILLFTFSEKAIKRYKKMQDMGLIEKRYIAMVHGEVIQEVCIKNKIDHNKRNKVKVLSVEDRDSLRYTRIIPKTFYPERGVSLVQACILKGKRHQIRAHLSYIGHPILGDPLYGTTQGNEERMFLHNFMVSFPDFKIKIFKGF